MMRGATTQRRSRWRDGSVGSSVTQCVAEHAIELARPGSQLEATAKVVTTAEGQPVCRNPDDEQIIAFCGHWSGGCSCHRGRRSYVFDSVNRPVEKLWTMAVWGVMLTPTGCVESTGASAPIPSGDIMCAATTTYDGVDNAVAANPVAAAGTSLSVSYTLYDAVHRAIVSTTPRYDGVFTNLVTVTLHNQDGQVTDVCPPREIAEGSAQTSTHALHRPSTGPTRRTTWPAGWRPRSPILSSADRSLFLTAHANRCHERSVLCDTRNSNR